MRKSVNINAQFEKKKKVEKYLSEFSTQEAKLDKFKNGSNKDKTEKNQRNRKQVCHREKKIKLNISSL